VSAALSNAFTTTQKLMIYADDPYTLEQLKEPRMNELIVKPLVGELYDPDDISVGKKAQLHQPEALWHTI
jgi:hypothetical protein